MSKHGRKNSPRGQRRKERRYVSIITPTTTGTSQAAIPDKAKEAPKTAQKECREKRGANSETSQTVKRFWMTPWRVVVAFGVIIGIAASLVQLYSLLIPRIPISGDHMLDPSNPTTTQFEIYNDGLLDLQRTAFGIYVHKLDFVQGSGGLNSMGFARTRFDAKVLPSGQRTVLPFDQIVPVDFPIKSAKITVWGHFTPKFTLIPLFKHQTFYLVRDHDGKAHWNPMALDFEYDPRLSNVGPFDMSRPVIQMGPADKGEKPAN